jgi:cytochrome b subunit of formate dehydrogenase
MSDQRAFYVRFPVAQRIEHLLLVLSFTTLGVTGLIQKFIGADISLLLIRVFGGIESTRIIHRVAATIFFIEVIYHLFILGYKVYVERVDMTMLPGLKDARDGIQALGYNLGLTKTKPSMGRYTFAEKAEYWALIWGGIVMGITGFMLWNPIITTKYLPGVFIPAAKAAHGGEAVLAVLAILVWHFYHVHFKRWNTSMINGKMPRHEMEDEHLLELEKIEAGVGPIKASPSVLKKRKTIFFPIASILSLAALFMVYQFVTVEKTAVAIAPPAEEIQVLSTAEPTQIPTLLPTATALPHMNMNPYATKTTNATTWDDGIGAMLQSKCGSCHGTSGGLSLATFADIMKGATSGAVITPGDPTTSLIVTILEAGGHPGQLSAEELAALKAWILAGAPEK